MWKLCKQGMHSNMMCEYVCVHVCAHNLKYINIKHFGAFLQQKFFLTGYEESMEWTTSRNNRKHNKLHNPLFPCSWTNIDKVELSNRQFHCVTNYHLKASSEYVNLYNIYGQSNLVSTLKCLGYQSSCTVWVLRYIQRRDRAGRIARCWLPGNLLCSWHIYNALWHHYGETIPRVERR